MEKAPEREAGDLANEKVGEIWEGVKNVSI